MNFRCFYRFQRDMRSIVVILVLTVLYSCFAQVCQQYKHSPFMCKSGSFILDLEPICNDKPSPTFPDVKTTDPGKDPNVYSYDPCTGFDEGDCHNAAVCQHTSTQYISLGRLSDVKFSGDPHSGNVVLQYNFTTDKKNRFAEVEVECSKQEKDFVAFGQRKEEGEKIFYSFKLNTKQACVPGRLSVGSILLIIFFVFVLIYLIGGMLFLRFARGAKGWEQIPNYEFWYEFPLYVRDGVVFTINGCKTETTYEKI